MIFISSVSLAQVLAAMDGCPEKTKEEASKGSCHLEVGDRSFVFRHTRLATAGGSLRNSYNRKLAESRALPCR